MLKEQDNQMKGPGRGLFPTLWNFFKSLRTEEQLSLLFFLPMSFLTFYFVGEKGYPNGARERFYITFGLMVFYGWLQWKHSDRHWVRVFRDIAPFFFCIAIYTNLHDLVYFLHPTNIDDRLIAIDQWLFGMQPAVEALRYRPEWWERWLEINYSLFFYFPVILALVLYLKKRITEYRTFLVTIIATFFTGYFLYVIFPAVGPKHYFKELFRQPELMNWKLEENMYNFFHISERVRRDAFPSLHNAITVLVMAFAFRYERLLFFLLAPFAFSLMLATVWLGHHYVIDVFAGWLLAFLAYRYFPRWEERRTRSMTEYVPDQP